MRFLEESNSERQEIGWWLLGLREEERGVSVLTEAEFQFSKMKRILDFGCPMR